MKNEFKSIVIAQSPQQLLANLCTVIIDGKLYEDRPINKVSKVDVIKLTKDKSIIVAGNNVIIDGEFSFCKVLSNSKVILNK
jgi:hypothetical protein